MPSTARQLGGLTSPRSELQLILFTNRPIPANAGLEALHFYQHNAEVSAVETELSSNHVRTER